MGDLNELLTYFQTLTTNPEVFLSHGNLVDELKLFLKNIYDFANKLELNGRSNILPELIIDSFDDEQIWQELEIQNDETVDCFISDIIKTAVEKNRLVFPVHLEPSKETDENSEEEEDLNENGIENLHEEPFDEDESSDGSYSQNKNENNSDDNTHNKSILGGTSIVDDKFFKLSEMENFLEKEDKMENVNNGDVDFFEDYDSDFDDVEGHQLMYGDFFKLPGDVEDSNQSIQTKTTYKNNHEEDPLDRNQSKKNVRFSLDDNSDGEEPNVKSQFEARQERMKNKIEKLENEVLQEKPWQLKGEIGATSRPENSLLEEFVEFDITQRPAPIITEETTLKLEDIIKQRIKDKAFDDVERKIKPVYTPQEFKKKLVLDQEKSKVSLAQIYEQEYMKQRDSKDPESAKGEEESVEHVTIRKMMNSLFSKLDALSNFHYTPKPCLPELKIVSNMPAISVEEVAPVATTDANLLAPQEVADKSTRILMGKDERSETDKKRQRRKKKAFQAARFKQKEIKQKLLAERGVESSKSTEEVMKKVTKYHNVSQLSANDSTVKTSKDFFSRLQDDITTGANKIKASHRKVQKISVSAKRLKL